MPLSHLLHPNVRLEPIPGTQPNRQQAEWEPYQARILQHLMVQLSARGFSNVSLLSSHLGWGTAVLWPMKGAPSVTDPHYFYADSYIVRVSPSAQLTLQLTEEGGSWLVPQLRGNERGIARGDDVTSAHLWDIDRLNVELMYIRSDGSLRSLTLPRPTLATIQALPRLGIVRRGARKHRAIRRAIRKGS